MVALLNCGPRPASKVRRVNRISWSVTVPTAFGLNADALPPATRDPNTDQGEAASILQQGFRKVAVVPFNGLPQVGNTLPSFLFILAVRCASFPEAGRFSIFFIINTVLNPGPLANGLYLAQERAELM